MGKHKHLCRHDKLLVVVGFLLFLLRLGETTAAGYFEDADQSNDFLSSSPDHHFDLRHTIPGEPHIDYPIYSTVPKTSFGCADRHEGYYADIETRCQAFRICTHTARSEQGFGFLCPNGTLFSQKNFVCDWYRNVNCEESEQYYSKNDANRIGSKKDMMETVRQMMEYPMKSISKALQNSQGNSKRPTYSSFNTLNMGDNSGVSTRNAQAPVTDVTNNSRKTAVTRAQVESVSKYGSDDLKESVNVAETQNPAKPFNPQTQNQDEFSIDLRSSQDAFGSNDAIPVDVYVNSLGELSTDPGVNFDKSQSHILALGQQDREKAMDFAQTINVALNNLDDLSPTTAVIAPDYVKRMRSTQEGTLTSFANNINDLQQKLAKDKERSSPHKHAIRFLSRGFAAQDEVNKKTTAPYLYTRPKQTPSTIRFTPNALSTDSLKSYSYDDSKSELHKAINTLEASSEDIIDTVAILTTTPRLQISKDKDYLREAVSSVSTDDGSYLSPPSLENPEVNDEPIRVLNEIYDSTTSDSKTKVDAQVEPERQELLTPKKDLEVDEDRISVNKQAANLLLAGVKLSLLDMSPNSYEPVTKEITSPKKPTTTTTIRRGAATRDRSTKPTSKITTTEATPTTKAHQSPTVFTSTMKTSTETVTEISSTEKRVRNFRRFATVRRASLKPDIIAKRTYVRTTPKSFRVTARTTTTPAPALTTTAATTTRTNTTPARSYQKRFGISRLRAPRMTTARSTIARTSTTTEPPLQTPATTVRNVRHSDKETATYGYNPDAGSSSSSTAVATWESVRRNLQRYEVNRKTSELNSYDFTSEAPITRSPTSQTYVTPKERSRKRNSNFKTQATEPRSKTPVITMEPKTKTTKMSTIQQVEPPNYISPFTLPTTSITHSYPNPSSSPSTTFDHNFLNSVLPSPVTSLNFGQQSSSVTDTVQLSVSPTAVSSDVLSFDKLTQSIVDNSILQNFQNSPYDSAGAASNFNGRSTPKSSANKFPLKHARSFSYEKQAAKAPSELTPPIRPNYLSQNPTIPRAQLPRVVVARAEGQRIEPNSLQSIITNLVEQPGHGAKSSQRKVPYVPLKDFLTSKFGANNNNNIQLATEPTTQKTQNRQEKPITITQQQPEQHQQQQQLQYQLNGNSIFQQQQQQLYQQPQVYQQQQPQYQQQQLLPQQQYQQQQPQYQQQSQYQQQQIHQYQQPNQQYLQQSLHTQQLQQPKILSSAYKPQVEQQEVPFGLAVLNKLQTQQQKPLQHQQQQQQHQQPQMQQPFNTQNIFTNFQQQQQQLPQFPPLQNAQPQQQQQLQQSGNFRNYVQRIDSLNVPLPTLPNGLLPSISAQRRSDDAIEQLDLSSDISARPSTYDGASSYDVPLNSIGRLPNDKTLLRQRQRQRHGRRN